jgi:hypothetical protein
MGALMNPIQPGLRRISYDARSAAKVALIVQPGDTLAVSDGVADQLLRSSPQFKDTGATPAPSAEAAQDQDSSTTPVDESPAEPAKATRRTSSKKG